MRVPKRRDRREPVGGRPDPRDRPDPRGGKDAERLLVQLARAVLQLRVDMRELARAEGLAREAIAWSNSVALARGKEEQA